MCIAEEGLDLGLHLELLRGWALVVELLRGLELVVLQEQYMQVCDLLESQEPAVLAESLELCGLLLALSLSLVFSSQVCVSPLLAVSFSLNWGLVL